MGPIGIPELIIVLVILLVIFGPKRLPGAGKALGTGMREFKDSLTGSGKDKDDDEDEGIRQLNAASAATAETTVAPAEERRETPVTEPRA